MSRYIGPRLRIVRRLGKLRGFTRKKPFRRVFRGKGALRGKVIPPGQHGLNKLFKTRPYDSCESDYLIRLKVKQRLRLNYGLTERQLVNYVRKAKKIKESTGQVLLQFLEMRLDNIVFRLNMAPTIPAARQLICHGHIRVNGKKVNIASYSCKPKDVISVAMKQKSLKLVNQNLQEYYKRMRFYKKRLEKTLPFVLVQQKLVPTVAMALQLISQGNVRINNRTKKDPRYVCKPKDSVSVKSQSILATAVAPQVTVASTKPQITEASTKPQVTATAAKKQANKASAKPQVNATAAKKQANKASAAKAA